MVRIVVCAALLGLTACAASNPVAVSTSAPAAAPVVVAPALQPSPAAQASAPIGGLTYEASVLPILERHCQPCHFPGGKMYDEIPFTDSYSVVTHRDGVLSRVVNLGERDTIAQWLATQP